jgi:hypothetical protein
VVGHPKPPESQSQPGRPRSPSRQFSVPGTLSPPAAPAPRKSRAPQAAPVAAAVAPPTRPAPAPAPQVGFNPPQSDFAPTPSKLTASDLFGDLGGSGSVPTPGAASPAAPAGAPSATMPRKGNNAAAEEGLALYRNKQYAQARNKLAEALRRDPRNRVIRVTYHLAAGFDLKSQNREDDARKQFESALVLDPDNAEAVAGMRAPSGDKPETTAKRTLFGKLLNRE